MANTTLTGWSRGTWGEAAWNRHAPVLVTQSAATSALGSLTASGSLSLTLSSLSTQSSVGLLSVDAHSVGLPALSATSAVGSITPADVIGLTGLSSQTAVGSITISSNPVTLLTGVSATSAVGSLTVSNITGATLTGQSATSAVGSLTTTQLSIASLSGQTATTTLGNSGIILRYYQDLVPNTSANYTDLSA